MATLGMFAPRMSFKESGDFLGKHFASTYFANILMIEGTFEECHIYVRSQADKTDVERHISEISRLSASYIRVFLDLELPRNIRLKNYEHFHLPDAFPLFQHLCSLRNANGADFSISALIHSISYPIFEDQILHLLLCDASERDVILCPSRAGKETMRRLITLARARSGLPLPQHFKMSVCPFGVDTQRFSPQDCEEARGMLGLPLDRRFFLSVGRFSVEDKYDCGPLIEAYQLAAGQLSERWDLILAGGTQNISYIQFLKQLVAIRGLKDRIIFLPDFSDEQKPIIYGASDIFVSPSDSFQETFGVAALEAMACGLPVVVSDWNGYRDTVEHDVSGKRVPTYMPRIQHLLSWRAIHDNSLVHLLTAQSVVVDIGQLSRALVELGADENRRLDMGAAARCRVEALFDYQSVGRRLQDILRNVVDPHESFEQSSEIAVSGQPSPWTLFSHYPTRFLFDSDEVICTEYGKQAKVSHVPVFLCDEMEFVIMIGEIRNILDFCGEKKKISTIVEKFSVGESRTEESEQILYSIHWLLKQGLVVLA